MASIPVQVLLVEDNPGDAELIREQLDSIESFTIRLRHERMLRTAKQSLLQEPCHLILLDLHLPDSSGLATIRALRLIRRDVPIVVLTGMNDEVSALNAQRLTASAYLVKGDYTQETLTQLLEELLRGIRPSAPRPDSADQLDLVVAHRPADSYARYRSLQRENAELQALVRERSLLARAVSDSVDATVITDPDGSIVYVNPAFEQITEFSQQEVLGENPRFLKSGAHDKAFYEDVFATLQRERVWKGQFVNRRKDGELITMESTITGMYDEDGVLQNYLMVSQDVTEYKALQRQLVQSSRLNAIGRLASGISHDFNNLLQVILSYGTMIAEKVGPEHPELRECATGLCEAANRGADLTRQLLAFSRNQTMNPEVLDLNTELEDVMKLVGRLIGEDVAVHTNLAPNLPPVEADPVQLEQIVVNLCVNARDAMSSGGELWVQTAAITLDAVFCRSRPWAEPGAYVMLAVRDTGSGMSPATLDRIFEPFFTTKSEGEGTGMGLATVYGAVKQHNGLIDCTSTEGIGTRFSIYFPVSETTAETGHADPELTTPPSHPESGLRILVAEDDRAVAAVSARTLEMAGNSVQVAYNGQAAFQELSAPRAAYDLVLCDLIMPRTSGLHLMKMVMESTLVEPKPLFLFCSGYSDEIDLETLRQHGRLAFLQKPFTPTQLLTSIRVLMESAGK